MQPQQLPGSCESPRHIDWVSQENLTRTPSKTLPGLGCTVIVASGLYLDDNGESLLRFAVDLS
jgi:hypothetical protein